MINTLFSEYPIHTADVSSRIKRLGGGGGVLNESILTLLARGNFCQLLITFANSKTHQIRPDRMLILIWVHNIETDIVFELFFKVSRLQEEDNEIPCMKRAKKIKKKKSQVPSQTNHFTQQCLF